MTLDLSTFRQGLGDVLMAAAEEHDRDEDEILSPASLRDVSVPQNFGSNGWAATVRAKDGRRFRVTAVEEVI